MKQLLTLFVCFPMLLFAQIEPVPQDTLADKYIRVEGDSLFKKAIDLDEVIVLPRLSLKTKDERVRYYILKRKTLKVYPYAKMAAERLVELNKELEKFSKRRKKKKHAKKVQKFIEKEFSAELKKLTKTEGQILVKLIHRQTGKTAFQLVKELRNGWRAFWYNNTASLFDIKLKREFAPLDVEEDFLIEDILLRAFQNGQLERQDPAFDIDYYDLTDKWLNPKKSKK
ncbi:DUF4294 domain-containing protein [Winogradskyella jejuensis]|uniref:DUF4294 domain-containing protein n=1 Tax=Winogradskyella jejuensis TaxID=1089305 RepID=A0A1M5UPG4_9FLAO|nr:DUF4294 domain-containing protein [Winogradskyella jejuensis]SHH64942.1 protein of unknown function [Winogradskyella jejuensis]